MFSDFHCQASSSSAFRWRGFFSHACNLCRGTDLFTLIAVIWPDDLLAIWSNTRCFCTDRTNGAIMTILTLSPGATFTMTVSGQIVASDTLEAFSPILLVEISGQHDPFHFSMACHDAFYPCITMIWPQAAEQSETQLKANVSRRIVSDKVKWRDTSGFCVTTKLWPSFQDNSGTSSTLWFGVLNA